MQVLGVDHEGDRHDLAVDADELALLQVLALLGDEIVERADQAAVEQRHDRVVGDHGDGVGRGIGGQRRQPGCSCARSSGSSSPSTVGAGAFLGAARRRREAPRNRSRGCGPSPARCRSRPSAIAADASKRRDPDGSLEKCLHACSPVVDVRLLAGRLPRAGRAVMSPSDGRCGPDSLRQLRVDSLTNMLLNTIATTLCIRLQTCYVRRDQRGGARCDVTIIERTSGGCTTAWRALAEAGPDGVGRLLAGLYAAGRGVARRASAERDARRSRRSRRRSGSRCSLVSRSRAARPDRRRRELRGARLRRDGRPLLRHIPRATG